MSGTKRGFSDVVLKQLGDAFDRLLPTCLVSSICVWREIYADCTQLSSHNSGVSLQISLSINISFPTGLLSQLVFLAAHSLRLNLVWRVLSL